MHEGGIRVPLIVSWPDELDSASVSEYISSFSDMMPTFCDIAQIDIPEESDGISFLPTILNLQHQVNHEYLYWEFPEYNGQQAIRFGDWKAIRKNIQNGNLELELYHLLSDPQEQNNVAELHPEIIKTINIFMKESHVKSSITPFQLYNID
ncbi:sulfatase-like hydrolase/transferase [Lentimicrobium sp. L6]|nr:sulfatase-like hydrolase/transferase [Lentimicrobium sp. S6]NPD85236.1 sulfatase-like hydrolase/transferase [Lentimicrobium sp. L6]